MNNKPLGRASVRAAAERIPAPRVHRRFLVPRILGIPSWVALLPISRRGLALTAQDPWDQPLTATRNPQPLDSPPPESPDAGQLPPEPSAQSADFRGLEELPLPSPQARFHPRTLGPGRLGEGAGPVTILWRWGGGGASVSQTLEQMGREPRFGSTVSGTEVFTRRARVTGVTSSRTQGQPRKGPSSASPGGGAGKRGSAGVEEEGAMQG